MFKKRAYSAMLTYQISDQEKERAQQAMRWFSFSLKVLDQCNDHLNLLYNPFKKNPNISTDNIFKIRSTLRNYRDKVADNFNYFKKIAFKSYSIMQPFTSDTQTDKILKSFVSSIEDLEIQVNRFIDLFTNLKSEEFVKGVINGIENIQKEIGQLKQLIEDRMKDHIQTNILAKNWVDNISESLQKKIEKKSPLVMQLVEERSKK